MAHLHRYHPERAIADPEAYYDIAYANYPRPLTARAVGALATRLAKPKFLYFDGQTSDEYFGQIPEDIPLIIPFTHRGRKRFHDVSAAAATVFATPLLMERLPDLRVWAAVTYMMHPVFGRLIPRLGGVPAIRSGEGDYKVCAQMPTSEERHAVTEANVASAQEHLARPRSVLTIFPAGTKQATTLQHGVGHVLEGLDTGLVLPVAFTSTTEQTRNIPVNLEVAFCEPVAVIQGTQSADYVEAIGQSLRAGIHCQQ